MKTFQHFSPNNALQCEPKGSVQTANCSKGFKRFQTTNKGLIKQNDRSFKKKITKFKFYKLNGRLALFCDARS